MIAIDSALLRLQEQAALSTIDCSLTSIGSMLARLPVDVSIGKMLIFACIFQVTHYKRNVINLNVLSFLFSMSIRP